MQYFLSTLRICRKVKSPIKSYSRDKKLNINFDFWLTTSAPNNKLHRRKNSVLTWDVSAQKIVWKIVSNAEKIWRMTNNGIMDKCMNSKNSSTHCQNDFIYYFYMFWASNHTAIEPHNNLIDGSMDENGLLTFVNMNGLCYRAHLCMYVCVCMCVMFFIWLEWS